MDYNVIILFFSYLIGVIVNFFNFMLLEPFCNLDFKS